MTGVHRRDVLRGAVATALGLGATGAGTGTAAAAEPAERGAEPAAGRYRRGVPRGAISIQLYTLRDLLARDLEGTLAALAGIGYRKVELAGLHGRTAAEFRAVLDRYGLRATSSHVGIDDGDWGATLDDAHTLGQRFIVHPYAAYSTADDWRRFADRLAAAGDASRAAGLRFGYHNHAHEFQALPTGEVPWDILVATDPGSVHLEVDLYWTVSAGRDPVEVIRAHPGRVRQFHAKDRGADGSFADLGEGTIDFPRIFARAEEAGVREFIVEHDRPPSPLDTARVGYDYLRTVRYPHH
jgi:sugar phosphate isomerase/epimerase